MRHLKFILSALAILLAGAIAAGFAARTVISPRTGEVVSAGVVSVPSVLGQTADEVLFYPWPLYETVPLEPLTLLLEVEGEGQAVEEMAESFSYRYFAPFSLFDVELDELAAYSATQCALISRNTEFVMFLKDFPVRAEEGTPLVIRFASSAPDGSANTSISYLVRPQNPEVITMEQQEQALEQVKADLQELLTTPELLDAIAREQAERDEAYEMFQNDNDELSYITPSGELRPIDNDIASLLAGYHILSWDRSLNSAPLVLICQHLKSATDLYGVYGVTAESLLDDVLDALDRTGIQVQLVSTPDQVIVLFICGTTMVGVYYDIQLERYSGVGLSG